MSTKALKGIRTTSKVTDVLEKIVTQARIHAAAATSQNGPTSSQVTTPNAHIDEASIRQLDTMIKESASILPLKAIKIAQSIAPSDELLMSLDTALHNTKLVFSSPEQPIESEAYQKRIQMLKLAEQERNYNNLTKNINISQSDDATLKSMMYAATIGANMIVAPISIGVLMYFFAGRLFSFLIPDYRPADGKIDIHGVIAGVVAGVTMMFIEMILFVIRNHEMDKFVTKKMKRQKNPFGYDKKAAERIFNG